MIQISISLSVMFGVLQVCAIFFCICLSFYVLVCFFIDTHILLVTPTDVGEVGRPVARLVGHDPLLRPHGGQGGGGAGGSGGVLVNLAGMVLALMVRATA